MSSSPLSQYLASLIERNNCVSDVQVVQDNARLPAKTVVKRVAPGRFLRSISCPLLNESMDKFLAFYPASSESEFDGSASFNRLFLGGYDPSRWDSEAMASPHSIRKGSCRWDATATPGSITPPARRKGSCRWDATASPGSSIPPARRKSLSNLHLAKEPIEECNALQRSPSSKENRPEWLRQLPTEEPNVIIRKKAIASPCA